LRFFPTNNTFVGYPTYLQTINVSLIAYDPQKSRASINFTIVVSNNKPIVINRQDSICVYADATTTNKL
jgi:hypothetical protein